MEGEYMMDNIHEKVVYLHRDKVVSIVSKNQRTDCKETQKKSNKISLLMFKFVARQILSSLWWLLLPLLGCVALTSLFLSYLLFGVSILTLLLNHDLHSHMENQAMIMIGISIGLFLTSKLLFFAWGWIKVKLATG